MARFHRAVRFSTVLYSMQLSPFSLWEVVNGTKIANLFHTIYCMSSVIFQPASAAASRVFLLSNLGSTKLQNNCSRISRWTLSEQLSFTLLHQSCFSLKSDHQDLLRSVYYFHCSSAEEWSSSHIFWGAFVTFTVPQRRNDLHLIFWGAFVTFTVPQRRNDLHHIFWGAFVTFTVPQRRNDLHHIFWGAFVTFTVPQRRNDLHHIFWGAFVTFTVPQRRNDLHHIFWGAFVTFTVPQRRNDLHHIFWGAFVTLTVPQRRNDLHHIFWGAFVTFTVPQRRNDLHHIFWGAFVTFTVPQRRNDLHHIFWGAFVTFTVPQWRNDLHLTSSEERLFLHLSISIALYVWIISSYWDTVLEIIWYLDHLLSLSDALLLRSHWFTLQASEFHHFFKSLSMSSIFSKILKAGI